MTSDNCPVAESMMKPRTVMSVGILGTIFTGLFATDEGLFYGGGAHFLGVLTLGVLTTIAWAFSLGFLTFKVLDKIHGIRVEPRIEEEGLDIYEHGETCYNS